MSERERDHFRTKHATIKGTQSEQASFTNFARLFRQREHEAMRIVFFNGVEFLYPDSSFENEMKGEFDQIIIDDSKKVIIYTELKTTFSRKQALKKRQFERFKSLVDTHFPVGEGWKLVTAYGFTEWPKPQDNEPSLRPCTTCATNIFFVIDFESIQAWYKGLEDQFGDHEASNSTASPFKDIFATLLFLALVNKRKSREKQLITPAMGNEALFKTIQNISGSAENVLFWSNNQNILLEGEYKRLKFHSHYGTGELSLILLSNACVMCIFSEN